MFDVRKIIPLRYRPLSFFKRYVVRHADGTVIAGIFSGMKYPHYTTWGSFFPRLLGIYEKELHQTFRNFKEKPIEEIIVIGADDGYYPVGLSRYLLKPAVAFEKNEQSILSMKKIAQLNDVLIKTRGVCTAEQLFPKPNSLVLMDIEGEELNFLDVFERHVDCFWIIEVHGEEKKKVLISRLKKWYALEFIGCQNRTLLDLPIKLNFLVRILFKRYWLALMQEWRGNDSDTSLGWLILQPKNKW